MENALDAGATTIDVQVSEGGRALVRVADDGHGMTRDDAFLAVERHATSKIRAAADGTAWGVNSNDEIFRWVDNARWEQVPGALKQISVGSSRLIWGVNSNDDVYALSAYLLFKNEIIKEDAVIDAASLPKIQMPNRNGFIPQKLEEIHDPKKRGCRLGHCP